VAGALYVKDGIPAYAYNFLGMQHFTIASTKPLAPGKATIRFDFAYDGGGLGKGGTGALFVNNEKVAEGRIEHTQAMMFSADETADVGIDLGTPVVEAIGSEARSRFTGRIPKVAVEVKEVNAGDKAEAEKAQREAPARRRCRINSMKRSNETEQQGERVVRHCRAATRRTRPGTGSAIYG